MFGIGSRAGARAVLLPQGTNRRGSRGGGKGGKPAGGAGRLAGRRCNPRRRSEDLPAFVFSFVSHETDLQTQPTCVQRKHRLRFDVPARAQIEHEQQQRHCSVCVVCIFNGPRNLIPISIRMYPTLRVYGLNLLNTLWRGPWACSLLLGAHSSCSVLSWPLRPGWLVHLHSLAMYPSVKLG